ncbi:MAG: AmmeMemoRadiSam system radical SAM enzyme [Firmicutes bacterium]|nr:AmmeMemoRadiSam system radical SAM enzyme [Bacillota bacterium]
MDRRDFLKNAAILGAGCMAAAAVEPTAAEALPTASGIKEASFYKKIDSRTVQCKLCPLEEKLTAGSKSVCRVRSVQNGKLYVSNYGKPCAMHLDPVEKNPLYHFNPGMKSLALATAGCNLACPACQNWEMSQKSVNEIKSYDLSPSKAVSYAKKNECGALSFTFTEPAIFIEYCIDASKAAKESGLKSCVVSGGYINTQPLTVLTRYVDAFCVSLKGLSDEQYGGSPRPSVVETVKNTLKTIRQSGKWLEVACLIIPGKSDDEKTISEIAKWIKDNLGEFTPVHFSRFYPSFMLRNIPQTPVGVLEQAQKLAKKAGIKYAYIGNVPGHIGNNTYCHSCNKLLIQRVGFRVLKNNINNGKCQFCGVKIPGVWS